VLSETPCWREVAVRNVQGVLEEEKPAPARPCSSSCC
jgi:hypothetical protein